MQTKIPIAVIGSLFLLVATSTPLFAESTNVQIHQVINAKQDDFQETRKEIRTEVSGNAASRAAVRMEIKNDINNVKTEVRTNIAENHANRLERRFAFYATRLQNIASRIQTHIDTQKTAGKDVTTAQASLDKGKAKLTQAIADGKSAVTAFKALEGKQWNQQDTDVQNAIKLANTTRQEFIDARKLMMDAVSSLVKNNE